MITLPKKGRHNTTISSSCKGFTLNKTIYNIKKPPPRNQNQNNLPKSHTLNDIIYNKTFMLNFRNPINKTSHTNINNINDDKNIDKNKDKDNLNIEIIDTDDEKKILEKVHFIKDPIIDKEIEQLQERHINDNLFTEAIKHLSQDKKNNTIIRKSPRKQTVYGLNLGSGKETKRDSVFISKNYLPLYYPNLVSRNIKSFKNKHYSRNIVKTLNNKIFTSDNMKPGVSLDLDLFEKKFEEEVKNYQLSKIIKLNNLMQNDDNIAIINTLEELENYNFNDNNLVDGHLFHIRENNFNKNKLINKKESNYDVKETDLKEKEKNRESLTYKSKSFYKKKNKHSNDLFDKKEKIKNELDIYKPEITNYESKIYYFQNISISNKNKEGVEGINQDSFLELLSINGNKKFHLFGVMDGHGVNGHIISKYISRFISEYFISDKIKTEFNNCKNNEELYCLLTMKRYSFIKNLIYKCSSSLYKDLNYECDYSGSTCLLILIIGNNLICTNIGNSRAIILEKTELLQLSIDQTLNDPEETIRIIKKGGKVKKMKKKIVLDNTDINNKNFEISRSVGDKKLKDFGIIYDPVITEYTLNKQTKFLIMGTQGLWKLLSNEKAAIQVNKSIKSHNPLDSCRLLIQKAEDILKKSSSLRDDITVITLFFEEIQTNIIENAAYK